jgi:hypothetical protein
VLSKDLEPQTDGAYILDKSLKVKVTGDVGEPLVRNAGGKQEILYPVRFRNGVARILQELHW